VTVIVDSTAIFLGSLKASHEEIKMYILHCDQDKLSSSAIESLLKYLPSADQVEKSVSLEFEKYKVRCTIAINQQMIQKILDFLSMHTLHWGGDGDGGDDVDDDKAGDIDDNGDDDNDDDDE